MNTNTKHIIDTKKNGWKSSERNDSAVYYSGYLLNSSFEEFIDNLITNINNESDLNSVISEVNGHFGFIIESESKVLLVADKIRSIPIFYSSISTQFITSASAPGLLSKISDQILDSESLIAFSMSGYTFSNKTIYKNIKHVLPGEFVIFDKESMRLSRHRHYSYYSSFYKDYDEPQAYKKLLSVIHSVMSDTVYSLSNQRVVVPLSAGFDSRLVVSALKNLNYKNVITFSYGLKNSYEAKAAKNIAEQLGYPWYFVPYNKGNQRKTYFSNEHQQYLKEFDTFSATPFMQDFYAIQYLLEKNIITKQDIIINGNSGDYITGGHIPSALYENKDQTDLNRAKDDYYNSYISKHYSLWNNLLSEVNKNKIRSLMDEQLLEINIGSVEKNDVIKDYEYLEYMNRQSKYVVNGQRIYEYFDLEWRLPLWDDRLIDFFKDLPVKFKVQQQLYKKVLLNENWGNVWENIQINRTTIRPHWVRPLRVIAKLFHVFIGKEKWHLNEIRYFSYWMEQCHRYAPFSYWRIVSDGRAFRNAISWYTEEYLDIRKTKL